MKCIIINIKNILKFSLNVKLEMCKYLLGSFGTEVMKGYSFVQAELNFEGYIAAPESFLDFLGGGQGNSDSFADSISVVCSASESEENMAIRNRTCEAREIAGIRNKHRQKLSTDHAAVMLAWCGAHSVYIRIWVWAGPTIVVWSRPVRCGRGCGRGLSKI